MKIGGQIPWNAIPICEKFKISCLMGKLHTRDVLGNHLQDRSFRLVHWLSITLSLRKTSQESINLERKSYQGDILLQTLRSWKRWTHKKSILKDSMPKEVIFPKENGNFIFPVADGRITLSGGEQELRKSTLDYGNTHSRRKSQRFSWRIRRVSSTTSRLTSGCR